MGKRGKDKAPRKCSLCREIGHNARTCGVTGQIPISMVGLTHQQRYKERQKQRGRCVWCGSGKTIGNSVFCEKHLLQKRMKSRMERNPEKYGEPDVSREAQEPHRSAG